MAGGGGFVVEKGVGFFRGGGQLIDSFLRVSMHFKGAPTDTSVSGGLVSIPTRIIPPRTHRRRSARRCCGPTQPLVNRPY